MNNKVYDILKWIAIVFYPAMVVCVISILTALGYPNVETVAIILGAIETFLGSILGVSSVKYYKKMSEVDIDFANLNDWEEDDRK